MPRVQVGTMRIPKASKEGRQIIGTLRVPVEQEIEREARRRVMEHDEQEIERGLLQDMPSAPSAGEPTAEYEEPSDPEAAVFEVLDREKVTRAMVNGAVLKTPPALTHAQSETVERILARRPELAHVRDVVAQRVKQHSLDQSWSRVPGEVLGAMIGVGTGISKYARGTVEAFRAGEEAHREQLRQEHLENLKRQRTAGTIDQETFNRQAEEASNLDTFIRSLRNPRMDDIWIEENVFKPTAEAAEQILLSLEEAGDTITADLMPQYLGTFIENPSWRRAFSALASGVGSMGVAIPVAIVAGPSAGAALLSMAESGPIYQEAVAAGVSRQKAYGLATVAGALTFLLERYGLDTVINSSGTAGRRFLRGSLTESGTEMSQTIVQNAIGKHGYDDSIGYLDQIVEAAIGGLVGGPAALVTGGRGAEAGAQTSQEAPGATTGEGVADAQPQPGSQQVDGTAEAPAPIPVVEEGMDEILQASDEEADEVIERVLARSEETSDADVAAELEDSSPRFDAFQAQIAEVVEGDEVAAVSAILEARARAAGMTPDEYIEFHDLEVIRGDLAEDDASVTQQAQGVKASVTFPTVEDSRTVIRAFAAADVSSLVHELGHVFRRDLGGADLATLETWAGAENGSWTVAAEEKVARGFERYLADGTAPTPELARVFEQLKNWLTEIYRGITGTSIDLQLTPEVREVFDRMLGAQEDSLTQEFLQKSEDQRSASAIIEEYDRIRAQLQEGIEDQEETLKKRKREIEQIMRGELLFQTPEQAATLRKLETALDALPPEVTSGNGGILSPDGIPRQIASSHGDLPRIAGVPGTTFNELAKTLRLVRFAAKDAYGLFSRPTESQIRTMFDLSEGDAIIDLNETYLGEAVGRSYQEFKQSLDSLMDGQPLFQGAELPRQSSLGFTSSLRDGVAAITARGMPAKDWIARLKKMPGVKPDELQWTGVVEWLEAQEGKVSTDDLLAFIDANGVQVEEVVKGKGPNYEAIDPEDSNPDGSDVVWGVGATEQEALEDARYWLRTNSPENADEIHSRLELRVPEEDTKFASYTLPGGENYREVLLTLPEDTVEGAAPFRGSHFDEPNVLAHVRLNDRTGPNGERILFVEEIQSDWSQTGRKQGFKDPRAHDRLMADLRSRYELPDENGVISLRVLEDAGVLAAERQAWRDSMVADVDGVPAAPFVDSTDKWVALALKRVIRMAAEGGYDQVAWTPGEVQADRYDLSKQIDELSYGRNEDGTFRVFASSKEHGMVTVGESIPEDKLEDHVGKEIAKKMVNSEGTKRNLGGSDTWSLSGLDLKVGGEGMTAFYDKIVPKVAGKVAKKLDKAAKVGAGSVGSSPWQIIPDGSDFLLQKPGGQFAEERDVRRTSENPLNIARWSTRRAAEQAGEALYGAPEGTQEVWTLPITDKMRDSALQGQPLYQAEEVDKGEIPAPPKIVKKAQEAVKTRIRRLTGQRDLSDPVTISSRDALKAELKKAARAAKKAEAEGRKEGVAAERERMRELLTRNMQKRKTAETVKTLRARIKRELKTTKVKKKGGKPQGKFTPEIQQALDILREVSRLKKSEAEERLQANLSRWAEAEGYPPDEVLLENRLLEVVARTDAMNDPAALKELLEDLKAIKTQGKTLRASKMEERKKRDNAAREKTVEELGGLPAEVKARVADVEDYTPESRREAIKRFLHTTGKTIVGWDDIMDILSIKSGSKPGESFISRNNILRSVLNAQQGGERRSIESLHNAFMEAYGLKSNRQARRQVVKDNTETVGELYFETITEDGTVLEWTTKFTRAELRKRAMELMDPSLWPSFEKMGYTEETATELLNLLTDQDHAFIAAQLAFYRDYYDGTNEVYREMFGVNLPNNEWYSPIAREGIATPETAMGEFAGEISFRASATGAGALKSRVGSTKLIKKQSDLAVMQRHVAEMEHFKAWAEKIRELNAVWKDPAVRDAVKIHHGKDMLKMVDNFLEEFAYQGVRNASKIKWLDKLRIKLTTSVLAGKASITLKQLTSFVAYMDAMPVTHFWANWARFWTDPVGHAKEIHGLSELMKNRGQNITRDMKEAMSSDEYQQFTEVKSLTNLLLLNVKLGDHGAIYMGGWPLYTYLVEKKGMSKEEAIAEFERVTANTQQSGDPTEQSYLQRGGSFAKLFTMFMSSPNQYFRKYLGAIRNAKRQSPVQTVKTLVLYHFIIPMLFQFVSDGFTWDDEEQERAAWLGPLNGIFIVGDILDGILRKVLGMKEFSEELPMTSLAHDAVDATKLVNLDELTAEEAFRALRALGSAAGGATGLPFKTAVDITKGMADVSEGEYLKGVAEILGYSPFKAEEAARRIQQ